jgi:hypothetical protein
VKVEPFLNPEPSPPVLEYAQPDPPPSAIQRLREAVEPAIDFVGGPGSAMLIAMVFFIGVGVSFPGPVGAIMVMTGGLLGRMALHHWCRSSKW